MPNIIYEIMYRLRVTMNPVETTWLLANWLRPMTRDQADHIVTNLNRAMPLREHKVVEVDIDDIPF
jgi:hypothetical protein